MSALSTETILLTAFERLAPTTRPSFERKVTSLAFSVRLILAGHLLLGSRLLRWRLSQWVTDLDVDAWFNIAHRLDWITFDDDEGRDRTVWRLTSAGLAALQAR